MGERQIKPHCEMNAWPVWIMSVWATPRGYPACWTAAQDVERGQHDRHCDPEHSAGFLAVVIHAGIVALIGIPRNTKTPPDFSGGVHRIRRYASTVSMSLQSGGLQSARFPARLRAQRRKPASPF